MVLFYMVKTRMKIAVINIKSCGIELARYNSSVKKGRA